MKRILLLLTFTFTIPEGFSQSIEIQPDGDIFATSTAPDLYLRARRANNNAPELITERSLSLGAAQRAITDNVDLFRLRNYGYNGTSFVQGADMLFEASQEWNASGRGTDFRLRLAPNNSNTMEERFTVLNNGNVGISNGNPNVPLHINSDAFSSTSTNGALIIGLTNSRHLSFDGNEINAYNNTAAGPLYLNTEGNTVYIGTVLPIISGDNADLWVSGYTQLGATAPKIKMKKITGTTPVTGDVTVAHNLAKEKILDVSVLVNSSTTAAVGNWYPPRLGGNVNTEFRYFVNASNVVITDLGVSLRGDPYRILITYEE